MKSWLSGFLAFGILLPAVLIHAQPTSPQRFPAKDLLTVNILQDTGLFFPANRTLQDLSLEQSTSTSHTEVIISLDLLPGAPIEVPEREIQKWTAPATVKLVRIRPNAPHGIGRIQLEMANNFWLFGLTASNEIRSISHTADQRWLSREQAGMYIRPKLNLTAWLLGDPGITKVGVYESIRTDQKWSLRKIGDVELPQESN